MTLLKRYSSEPKFQCHLLKIFSFCFGKVTSKIWNTKPCDVLIFAFSWASENWFVLKFNLTVNFRSTCFRWMSWVRINQQNIDFYQLWQRYFAVNAPFLHSVVPDLDGLLLWIFPWLLWMINIQVFWCK